MYIYRERERHIYIYLSIYLFIYISIYLYIYIYLYLFIYISLYLYIYISIYLYIYMSIYLYVYNLYIYTEIYLAAATDAECWNTLIQWGSEMKAQSNLRLTLNIKIFDWSVKSTTNLESKEKVRGNNRKSRKRPCKNECVSQRARVKKHTKNSSKIDVQWCRGGARWTSGAVLWPPGDVPGRFCYASEN